MREPTVASATAGTDDSSTLHPPRDRVTTAIILIFALAAAGVCSYQLSGPNGLYAINGNDFDTGSYFGAAIRLVHGILPYRSFVLMHPPGMTLLLSPIAWLTSAIGTKNGVAVCRVVMVVIAVLDVILVGKLVQHRGRVATLVACAVLALQPEVLVTIHSVELEPVLALFCLLGALVVFDKERLATRNRLIVGGTLFGFAGAVKIWAIFPVIVIVIVIGLTQIRQRLIPFASGVTAGFVVPCLPFFILAPNAFFHDIVVAQIGRFGTHRTPLDQRLVALSSLRDVSALQPYALPIGVAILLLVVVVFAFGTTRLTQFEWFAVGTAAVVMVALLAAEQFFRHYADFFAPFGALTLAIAVQRVLGDRIPRESFVVLALAALGFFITEMQFVPGDTAHPYLISAIDRYVPAGSCVLTDNTALTIGANRFVPSGPNCTPIVDPFGTSVADGSGLPLADGGPVPPKLVKIWLNAFEHADYVVLTAHPQLRIPLVPKVTSYLAQDFHLVSYSSGSRGLRVYARNGFTG